MNNETLRDFVNKRKKEILFQLKELRSELRDLKAVETTLNPASALGESSKTNARGARSGPTLQDMILEVLKREKSGLTAIQILEKIEEKFEKQVPRSSLSPQLSRLRAKEVIALNAGLWEVIHRELELESDQTRDNVQSEYVGSSSDSQENDDLGVFG